MLLNPGTTEYQYEDCTIGHSYARSKIGARYDSHSGTKSRSASRGVYGSWSTIEVGITDNDYIISKVLDE